MGHDYNWCYYVVGSIDILGQKESLRELKTVPTCEQAEDSFIRSHAETIGTIETFRAGFRSYFEKNMEDDDPHVNVSDDKKAKFYEMRKSQKIYYQFFSDSTIVSTPLQTEDYHSRAINSVYAMLVAFGGMQLISISEKKPLRMGVEIGLATELADGDIYGPAIAEAYRLESEVAEYPRIVIGSEFLNYLLNLSNMTEQISGQDRDDKEYCRRMADLCLSMTCKDLDGMTIFDYLGDEFRNRNLKKGDFEIITGRARDFAKQAYLHYRDKTERKLALRYFLLHKYIETRIAN